MEAEFISLFTLTWGCFRSKELKRSCCKSSLREVVLRDSARERESGVHTRQSNAAQKHRRMTDTRQPYIGNFNSPYSSCPD